MTEQRINLCNPSEQRCGHLDEAESRVQELEGERDSLRVEKGRAEACEASYRRRAEAAEQEAHEWKRVAEERAHNLHNSESHLARLEEAYIERARVAHDALKAGPTDHHGRFEECIAKPCEQARAVLTH